MGIVNEKIEIPFSKGKIIRNFLLSLLVFFCIILFVYNTLLVENTIKEVEFRGIVIKGNSLKLTSIAFALFNIFAFFVIILQIKMILSKKPGLTIDKTGIKNDIGFYKIGHILWENIVSINISMMNSNGNLYYMSYNETYVVIKINNPDEYIERQKNRYLRYRANNIYKSYETPVCISGDTFKCTQMELYNILNEQMNKWKKQSI